MRGKYCNRSQKLGREDEEWIHLAQINYKGQAIVNTMNPPRSIKCGDFFSCLVGGVTADGGFKLKYKKQLKEELGLLSLYSNYVYDLYKRRMVVRFLEGKKLFSRVTRSNLGPTQLAI
jgi:hypothetical protein